MKRILTLTLLVCLLLCGCKAATPTPPEPPRQETVTVYLLEQTVHYYSAHTIGHRTYRYDEHFNVDSYQFFMPSGELSYTAYFEEKDANGMAGRFRADWGGEPRTLVWSEAGTLTEEQREPDFFTQFEYDQKGNPVKRQDFYDNSPESTLIYEYSGDALQGAYCIDTDDHIHYKLRAENGRIVEKVCYDEEGNTACPHRYEYDENGNLIQVCEQYGAEWFPTDTHSYRAVEVSADRAAYLLSQQNYLRYILYTH